MEAHKPKLSWDGATKAFRVSVDGKSDLIPMHADFPADAQFAETLSVWEALDPDTPGAGHRLLAAIPLHDLLFSPVKCITGCEGNPPDWAVDRLAGAMDCAYRQRDEDRYKRLRVELAGSLANRLAGAIPPPQDSGDGSSETLDARREYRARRLEHVANEWFSLAAENAHLLDPAAQSELEHSISGWLPAHRTCSESCRRKWTDRIVDAWALHARLSPWLAQDAEQAGLGGRAWRFAAGRVILHTCGFILLLAAIVGVFSGGSADWLGAAATGPLTVIAGMYVAVVLLSPYLGRAYVPRLLALSVIGYMAVTQVPEARHLQVQGADSWQPAALTLGSVVLVWAYVLFGQLRAKTQQVWTYAGRALYLTVLGWAHSMSVGLLGFWALRGQVPETQFVVLAAWAPVALAIGIIAQTLWQRELSLSPYSAVARSWVR